nr:PilZ domain-containing protein [uncultured Holophaga sp.]
MDQAFSQREFTRVPSCLTVRVTVDGTEIPNRGSQNVSLKGMLIHLGAPLPVGTPCRLTILLADGEIEVEVEAQVVHNYEAGTAFQFTKILGVESFEHLKNLVLYNAQDTEQVEEEFHSHWGFKRRDE